MAPRRLLLPWSSKWGGEIDWIYSTTTWCNGGEFLQQGFAYAQSGEREVERSRSAARVGGVGGGVRPCPPYIGGWPAPLAPPPSPRAAAPRVGVGGKFPPSF